MKYSIKIFARVRPTKKPTGICEINQEEDGTPTITFIVPRSEAGGLINNRKELFKFKFNQVFDGKVKQDEVFEQVAKPVIENCLHGYNGTIFAYGQTGSGKTFTVTGGAERYVDRGIIPRTLSYLFQQYSKSSGNVFATQISYLEIYNECGYDLLDPKHEASKLEDLPRILLYESSEGNIHLKNLSLHQANNEEEALNWLFLGDTNRIIAETPMNMASTRSHCIFTIHISSREIGGDIIRKSKLHLVDLAGSERVSKSGVDGTLLAEAKYINSSLHFLQQVIVALSEKSRSHIPYRNSMMTLVLRDSLGGNCMTSMIATLSVEKTNIEESISTCRFAQRVALIKNEAVLNEELDPKLMVARLQSKVEELQQELLLATGTERTDELSVEEKNDIEVKVNEFIEDTTEECRLSLDPDMRQIQFAFNLLKQKINEFKLQKCPVIQQHDDHYLNKEKLTKLEETLKQRDEEINVLLKMLKQERKTTAERESLLEKNGIQWSKLKTTSLSPPLMGRTSPLSQQEKRPNTPTSTSITTPTTLATPSSVTTPVGTVRPMDRALLRAELSEARQIAFDNYRHKIANTLLLNEHKEMLKKKYSEAKALGDKVNKSRLLINQLKTKLEKYRISRGLQDNGSCELNSAEEEARVTLEQEKLKFKELYTGLKDMKTEIEHLQHLMDKAKLKLQQDFEQWWKNCQNSPIDNTAVAVCSLEDKLLKKVKTVESTQSRGLPLIGDPQTDADIIAFYKAHHKLLNSNKT